MKGRQGIATDGEFYYVSGSKALYKYDKTGKLLLADKVVVLARDAGAVRLADPAWGSQFAAAAAAALAKPTALIDAQAMSVSF